MTVQVADTPSAVAVMVAVPGDTAVTRPFASTVATLGSLEVQVTVLLVASSGVTIAVRVAVSSTERESSFTSKDTPVTETYAFSASQESTGCSTPRTHSTPSLAFLLRAVRIASLLKSDTVWPHVDWSKLGSADAVPCSQSTTSFVTARYVPL